MLGEVEWKSEDIPGVCKNQGLAFLHVVPTATPLPKFGDFGVYFLMLGDCIFKSIMFTVVIDHYLSNFQSEVLIYKEKKLKSLSIKLFCTVCAQTLHPFQIQYFTVSRALQFRTEWGVLGTCTVGQFRPLDCAEHMKSAPVTSHAGHSPEGMHLPALWSWSRTGPHNVCATRISRDWTRSRPKASSTAWV